jgi:hypothetical protein
MAKRLRGFDWGKGKNTNGQDIDVKHALVHTAEVGVKVLTINKKQVTMGVFRQIREKSIFSDEWQGEERGVVRPAMLGIPWGTVDYTWSKSPKWCKRYLVWQEGEYLRRMPLPSSDEAAGYTPERCTGTRWVCYTCKRGWISHKEPAKVCCICGGEIEVGRLNGYGGWTIPFDSFFSWVYDGACFDTREKTDEVRNYGHRYGCRCNLCISAGQEEAAIHNAQIALRRATGPLVGLNRAKAQKLATTQPPVDNCQHPYTCSCPSCLHSLAEWTREHTRRVGNSVVVNDSQGVTVVDKPATPIIQEDHGRMGVTLTREAYNAMKAQCDESLTVNDMVPTHLPDCEDSYTGLLPPGIPTLHFGEGPMSPFANEPMGQVYEGAPHSHDTSQQGVATAYLEGMAEAERRQWNQVRMGQITLPPKPTPDEVTLGDMVWSQAQQRYISRDEWEQEQQDQAQVKQDYQQQVKAYRQEQARVVGVNTDSSTLIPTQPPSTTQAPQSPIPPGVSVHPSDTSSIEPTWWDRRLGKWRTAKQILELDKERGPREPGDIHVTPQQEEELTRALQQAQMDMDQESLLLPPSTTGEPVGLSTLQAKHGVQNTHDGDEDQEGLLYPTMDPRNEVNR